MPDKFTDEVASYISKLDNLKDVTVIVPGKRMITYLTKSLASKISGPVWLPEVKTLTDWIDEVVPEPLINSTEAVIILYEAYKSVWKEKADTFSEFFKWGNMLHNDFNEIDVYLLNHKEVYKNLKDIKDIEEWSFGQGDLSENQKKYLNFWEQLGSIYEGYNQLLKKEGLTTFGRALRWVAENMPIADEKEGKKFYVFAGFNAFSGAETSIIDYLVKAGRVKIFWDMDVYYTENPDHEAGYFYRKTKDRWPKDVMNKPGDNLLQTIKEINVTAVPQHILQGRLAASLLDEIPQEEYPETVVVLGDERLLEPFLSGVPPQINRLNVTMGLTLKNTPIKSLMEALLNIQTSYYRYKSFGKGVYYKDLFTLLRHPYMQKIFPEYTGKIEDLHSVAIQKNYVFLRKSFLEEKGFEPLMFLFKLWPTEKIKQTADEIFKMIIHRAEIWAKRENRVFEAQVFTHFKESLQSLHTLLEKYNPEVNLAVYRSLLNHFLQHGRVSYEGSPLDDIQVMGLLETRGLDFKNIIFVSMNEDTIPKKSREQSLMPYDLKRYFNLPVRSERDAIFAHHFYRLLHRTEKIHIIYNAETDDFGGGEKSRYITQLEHEFPKRSKNNVKIKNYTYFSEVSAMNKHQVVKTPELLERILSYLNSGVSPTALNTYYTCPMDFYHKYLLNLGEEDEVEEEFSFSIFGTILHNTLEALYKPKEGKWITSEDITGFIKNYEMELLKQSEEFFDKEYLNQGSNHVYYEAVKVYLYRYLAQEKKWLQKEPCFIEKLEEKLSINKEFEIGGKTVPLVIKGKVDRIDRIKTAQGEVTRIVDYKSGRVNSTDLKIDPEKSPKPKALQLAIYHLLYQQENLISVGNISLQSPEDGFLPVFSSDKELSIPEYANFVLKSFVEELLDADKPFEHNPESKYCLYCE